MGAVDSAYAILYIIGHCCLWRRRAQTDPNRPLVTVRFQETDIQRLYYPARTRIEREVRLGRSDFVVCA